MHQVFLALGSNVGDKQRYIAHATQLLAKNITNVQQAPLYKTKPVGYTDQDTFVNTVVGGETPLAASELLVWVKGLEQQMGRIKRFRWGPREIDIDILFYDDVVYKTENLEIPHPRLHERDFVLAPLADIAPNLIHPVLHKSIQELLSQLSGEASVLQRVK